VRSRHATTAIQRAENFGRHRTLGTSDDRAWFLKNSRWEDSTWILAPTNALEERLPVRLHWDFSLRGWLHRFTDARHAPLLQTSKRLIALIRGPLAVHGTAAAAEFRPELLPHAAPAGALDGPGRPQALCRPRSAGAAAVPAPAVGVSDVAALDTRRLNGAAAPRLVQLPLPLSRRTRRRSFVRPVPGEQPSRKPLAPGKDCAGRGRTRRTLSRWCCCRPPSRS
jgi:hypothetical protein